METTARQNARRIARLVQCGSCQHSMAWTHSSFRSTIWPAKRPLGRTSVPALCGSPRSPSILHSLALSMALSTLHYHPRSPPEFPVSTFPLSAGVHSSVHHPFCLRPPVSPFSCSAPAQRSSIRYLSSHPRPFVVLDACPFEQPSRSTAESSSRLAPGLDRLKR